MAYARFHRGLSYGSAGQLSRGPIAVGLFAHCKGLTFKHVPLKGEAPALGYIVVGPRGMPPAITKKLDQTFKKVAESSTFQKVLTNFDLPYEYKDPTQLEEDVLPEYESFKNSLQKMGAKKEG